MPSLVDTIADRLLEARAGGPLVPADFIAANPIDRETALAVQRKVQEKIGPVGAWKVGPGPEGAPAVVGPCYAKDVHKSPVTFKAGTFRNIGVECEIAFRLGRDLTTPPYDLKAVLDAIEAAVPLIEIVETRLADKGKASKEWQLADNQSNGAVLVGSDIPDWRDFDIAKQGVSLTFDGKIVAECDGHRLGDVRPLVQRLANNTGGHCGGLQAGQIVTTGAMCGNIPCPQGTAVIASYPGLGELKIQF